MPRKTIEQIRAELDELNARMAKNKTTSDIQIISMAKVNKEKAKKESFKQKMSNIKKGKKRPDLIGDNNPKKSLEARQRQSELMKGVKKTKQQIENYKKAYKQLPLIICPYCGKQSKNQGNMNRYHFDNCKNK